MKFKPADLLYAVMAASLHAAAILFLLYGLPEPKAKPPAVPVIQAKFLDISRAQLEKQRAQEEARRKAEEDARRKAEEEARRKAEEEARKKAEAEAKRRAEEEVRRQAEEEARRKAEAEAKRKAEEEARRKAEAEAKRKAEEEARRKAEAEAKRKAEEDARRKAEAKRKAEEEARRKAEAEAKRKAEAAAAQKRREAALASAMAEEEALLQAQQDQADESAYARLLQDHIRKNWRRPTGTVDEFTCQLTITQSSGGDVIKVDMVKSCGNPFLDASVLKAVDDASPLPLPENRRVFKRDLILNFEP